MKKIRVTVIIGVILAAVAIALFYGLLVYLPQKASVGEHGTSTVDAVDYPVVVDYQARQMLSVTPPSSTSTYQACLNKADVGYFDTWTDACFAYYDASHKNIEQYNYCIAHATTSEAAANNHCDLTYHRRCDTLYPVETCAPLLKQAVVPTNCHIRDGSGEAITKAWEAERLLCESLKDK